MKSSSVWIISMILILTSCTVYKEYPIDVYKPAKITVPPNVENIAVISRNFKYNNDTLQHYYKFDNSLRKAKGDPANLDSLLQYYCLNELALNLKNKNIYNEVRIYPEVFKPHTGTKLPSINFAIIDKFTEETQTDLVISLETFSTFYTEYSADKGVPNPRNVITANIWSVYNPVSQKIIDHKTMIDTLYWEPYDSNGNFQKNTKLPPRLTALKTAAQMSGENYAKRFFASWEPVKRMYSMPHNPDFEAAEKYLVKGDWDNAIMLWMRYADGKKGKLAIQARYNLALGYEMKDDLDTAIKWIISAGQIATEFNSREDIKRIDAYRKILTQREKDVIRLNSQ